MKKHNVRLIRFLNILGPGFYYGGIVFSYWILLFLGIASLGLALIKWPYYAASAIIIYALIITLAATILLLQRMRQPQSSNDDLAAMVNRLEEKLDILNEKI